MANVNTDTLSARLSVDALAANLSRVTPIECTWGVSETDLQGLPKGFIPGSIVFDLAAIKALPLIEQTEHTVAAQLSSLGISHKDALVVYDRFGVFSAPRLWWLLKTLGHKNVAILDGGLPAWIEAGRPLSERPHMGGYKPYDCAAPLLRGSDLSHVLSAIDNQVQIVDARPAGRFNGETPEPRAGLRRGHIPGSLSLPFGPLRHAGKLKSKSELAFAIGAAGINMERPIITTCGSGVTAAGLAFIFYHLGKTDVSVYTGSWAQYGASQHPISGPIQCA